MSAATGIPRWRSRARRRRRSPAPPGRGTGAARAPHPRLARGAGAGAGGSAARRPGARRRRTGAGSEPRRGAGARGVPGRPGLRPGGAGPCPPRARGRQPAPRLHRAGQAWTASPHPDLAGPYLEDEPDPLMRVKAVEALVRRIGASGKPAAAGAHRVGRGADWARAGRPRSAGASGPGPTGGLSCCCPSWRKRKRATRRTPAPRRRTGCARPPPRRPAAPLALRPLRHGPWTGRRCAPPAARWARSAGRRRRARRCPCLPRAAAAADAA